MRKPEYIQRNWKPLDPSALEEDYVCECGWKSSEHPGQMHDDLDEFHCITVPMVKKLNDLTRRVEGLEELCR